MEVSPDWQLAAVMIAGAKDRDDTCLQTVQHLVQHCHVLLQPGDCSSKRLGIGPVCQLILIHLKAVHPLMQHFQLLLQLTLPLHKESLVLA